MNGTCIEAEPVRVPDKDELVVFSYFTDLINHSSILDYATVLHETIREGITVLLKHAHWWKKYRALWKMQKVGREENAIMYVCFFFVFFCFYQMLT